ncbi:tubulin binding cofactor C-domain-containing protein [Papiliotrema laurentii]|uniref:Tubulin binding cofactor C-domain-containing protein n=1 Tax=Papiliotrema laurentii TaxID=5418 RepID=A0AAD9CZ41_PAPLA|nr:tubulin binding cofactor C-domain-containing protein [Papiliotrema laurentii]
MATISTSASADFHTAFQALRTEIVEQLEKAGVSSSDVSGKVSDLKGLYAGALAGGGLPSYDQRQYELSLKEVENRLSLLRAKEKPRAKFSFAKRSAGGSSTSSTSSTPPPPPPPPAAAPSPPSSSLTPDPPSSSSRALSAHGNPAASTYALSDLHYQHITPARITAQGEYTLSVENISQSVIDLRPVPSPPSTLSPSLNDNTTLSSLHVRNLSRCVLITPPMAGSALLHDLKDCLVVLASHQFRMHTSSHCVVRLHVSSVPVIEHCTDLTFGPYPSCLGIPVDGPNNVDRVADFDWVRPGPSPNWRLQAEQEGTNTDARLASLDDMPDVRTTLDTLLGSTQNNV